MQSGKTEPLTSCPRCNTAFPAEARFCPNCGQPVELTKRDPLLGVVIADRYRVVSVLGSGGMGVVYKVEHVQIGKLMAMKVLSGRLARNDLMRKRFQREAHAASKLSHPNTVQIFDFGESDRLAYLVMEYLPGRDLASLIAEGPLGFERVAAITAQIAASVGEAHNAGIVHRDIKPENVMLLEAGEERDFAKVLDFGIAQIRGAEEKLTGTGELVGTPFYMSPEQIRGDHVDGRADIYSLGGLMYKALVGEPPFTGENPQMLVSQHLTEPPMPLRKRAPTLGIPQEAERIVQKTLEKDPARRYQSMQELRDDLSRYLRSQGIASSTFEVKPERAARMTDELSVTRDDIDQFEAHTRGGGMLRRAAWVLALFALGIGSYVIADRYFDEGPKNAESEPNDDPSTADKLWPGIALTGKIGRRNGTEQGDPDVFRIELDGNVPRVAKIDLSGLPNMDLALDVVPKGSAQPILTVNSGGVGEPEHIPNLTLTGPVYYLRVREVAVVGKLPTENVSDRYTLELALTAVPPGFERELNDALELATPLVPGELVRGYIGWSKDKDTYCAATGQAEQVVTLSGVPNVDLVLQYLDRISDTGQRVDRGGIGEGERLELPASKSERASCFTISAKEEGKGARANPTQPYEIELLREK